ncbi:hypothetical protein PKOR_09435 [Pontibacter korlensis]|uniref:Lipoprotein n=1 Tax=Pontibacter korlensis TaxID=400092 RepID=A0A0E3ZDT1_9BACT|nr:hypothetical protein [Pontibacter korlensis]AKD03304.1 hypothetical protein PKOR_09435 [Pontibacter korlensis]
MKKWMFLIATPVVLLHSCTSAESKTEEIVNENLSIVSDSHSQQVFISDAKELINFYIDSLTNLTTITGTLIQEEKPFREGYAYGYGIFADKTDSTKYYLILEETVETSTTNPRPNWKVLDALSISNWTDNQMNYSLNTMCKGSEFTFFTIVNQYTGDKPEILKAYRLNHKHGKIELVENPVIDCVNIGCGDDEDCD